MSTFQHDLFIVLPFYFLMSRSFKIGCKLLFPWQGKYFVSVLSAVFFSFSRVIST